jgi:hypothetical protein
MAAAVGGEQSLVDGVGGELADDEVHLWELSDCVRVLGGHRLGHFMAAAAHVAPEREEHDPLTLDPAAEHFVHQALVPLKLN